MKEVLPSREDLSGLDSVEVIAPEENQTHHRCTENSVSSVQKGSNIMAFLKTNAFVVLTMTAVALGIGLGFALRNVNMSARSIKYLSFPGELLMRILQMLMLPLLVSSVITGMSAVDRKVYGKIGLRAFSYYMVTTIIATFTGIALAVLIQPGKLFRDTLESSGGTTEVVQSVDAFLALIRCVWKSFQETKQFDQHYWLVPMAGSSDGINILGLLVLSLAFGLILSSMETEGKPLRDFFNCLNKAMMHLVNIVIWYFPVGILFLLAGQVVKMTDTGQIGREVAMYTLTVITGLIIHSFFTLPLIYFIVTRKNPLKFMAGLLQALGTAFGTSSSNHSLPVTLHCMEQNHNMDKQVMRLMLPVGATMNMDGAALYEAIAALFIAQINDMDFNLGQIIVLSLIVTAASTGAAGIPQAGMVSMMIVLESTGLPTEDISLLMTLDWILDRIRTATNVLGDCIGVGVVQHLSRHELENSSPADKSLGEENSQP
ncbi:excitatory amino acid transporter 1-like [Amphiprion ocellaris]|uniref:excitatory amino acid transporter 1-like n=1 Tax=Amphiprion ocellaris TaxID=80972 RepID=UPI002410B8F8|nr:excitatory amino acid transporter 1-like [Amphiprion ocellaris]